jgi:hypothetical protein
VEVAVAARVAAVVEGVVAQAEARGMGAGAGGPGEDGHRQAAQRRAEVGEGLEQEVVEEGRAEGRREAADRPQLG